MNGRPVWSSKKGNANKVLNFTGVNANEALAVTQNLQFSNDQRYVYGKASENGFT
jgi:hypothetical protein